MRLIFIRVTLFVAEYEVLCMCVLNVIVKTYFEKHLKIQIPLYKIWYTTQKESKSKIRS